MLGKGIFTIPEICHYCRAHHSRVYSWFREDGVFKSDYNTESQKLVSFLDLMDVKTALLFREHNVPMHEIRSAYKKLREDLNREHPFAYRDLFVGSKKIFRKEICEDKTSALYHVVNNQKYIHNVMMPFLQQVDLDKETLLALRWKIATGIVIDPEYRSGAPIIENTGIQAETLMQCYRAYNNSIDDVTYCYDVTPEQVKYAIAFCENVGMAA